MSSTPPPSRAPTPPDPTGRTGSSQATWGLGDVWLGLLTALVMSAVAVQIAIAAGGYDDFDDLPMWLFSLSNAPLPLSLAAVATWAVVTKGRGLVTDLRFEFKAGDAGKGVVAGVLAQLILVPAVTFPIIWMTGTDSEEVSESARELADRANTVTGVVALMITTVFLAPVAEELFFRGLVLESYKKRRNLRWLEGLLSERFRPTTTSPSWNLWVGFVLSSAIFSVTHFIPLVMPALFFVGLLFARMAHRAGRLGPAIWAHAGFNATTVVSLLYIDGDDATWGLIGVLV